MTGSGNFSTRARAAAIEFGEGADMACGLDGKLSEVKSCGFSGCKRMK